MSRHALSFALMFVICAAISARAEFFFRDGDRVVVVGDSISVGGIYQRYIDNFVRTRFPNWKFGMRNGGVNGFTAQLGLPIIDTDVLIWQPTAVLINYGMNDGRRKDGLEYYKAGIVPYVDKLLANKLRVVLCSNTPLDLGDEPGNYTDFNLTFHQMAEFARDFAKERGLVFVDQFHYLHTLWGENRKRPKPIPVTEQTLSKIAVDSVHVRWGGYTTMAYIILKELGAPGEVSHAAIDVTTRKVNARQCEIRDLQIAENTISFLRADNASPAWIDDSGAPGLELVPFNDELNRMTLQMTGLKEARYQLKIDDKPAGIYTAEELKRGINLSHNRQSPIYDVGRRVNEMLAAQLRLMAEARAAISFKPPPWLKFPDLDAQKRAEFERLRKMIEEMDIKISQAAAPIPHKFEITPAPPEGKK